MSCPAAVITDTIGLGVTIDGAAVKRAATVVLRNLLDGGCEREACVHNISGLARPGWSTTWRCGRDIPRWLMIDRATVRVVAREPAFSWGTVNTIVMGVLAFFDHHASNGPSKAFNGRSETLRRDALGFRNLTHYPLHLLLHCSNLIQRIGAL
jgi:hypothetical protein